MSALERYLKDTRLMKGMKKEVKKELAQKLNRLIVLVVLFVVGLWCIDIGASGMVLEASGKDVFVKTLLFVRDAASQYHIGIILSLMCFIIISYLYIYEILTKQK